MQIHELQPKQKSSRKRVGRGGKRGTYSGKGNKGQMARSGNNREPIIRGLIKKYHKLRGYRFNPSKGIKIAVSVNIIDKHFKDGEVVSPKTLLEKRIISRIKNRTPEVKIIGGKLNKKVKIENCKLSKSVK